MVIRHTLFDQPFAITPDILIVINDAVRVLDRLAILGSDQNDQTVGHPVARSPLSSTVCLPSM